MDFALLPPEVNSARMYSGAGAGPMLAAAASWDALAAELETVGMAYQSVIAELNNGWFGPSATAMATAAAPYATWMYTTSAQAEQTATQAKAAIAAYEAAFAMTVPPPVVAANRAQLMALLATNFLGQNTPAIAATEAHYAQMWAQDATAMYGYAHSAAAASTLTAFTEPPRTTNPAGPAAQAGAVGPASAHAAHAAHAAATAAQVATTAGHTGTVISPATPALHGLASPVAAMAPPDGSALLAAFVPAALVAPLIEFVLANLGVLADSVGTFGIDVLGTFLIDALGAVVIGEELIPLEGLASSFAPVAANLGGAALLSGLSVPQAWTVAAASATQQLGASLPAAAGALALPAIETAFPIAGVAAAGLAGRATAAIGRGGQAARGRAGTTRERPAPAQLPAPPEQPRRLPYALLLGIDIELRELAELRAARILTDEEYAQQKRRLLGR